MRHTIKVSLGLCGLLAAGLWLVQCFSPDLPACPYVCGDMSPACPDNFECRADGYCHLQGSAAACPFSMDLAAPPDQASAADAGDGGGHGDGGG